ncbi:hypothetical protein F5X98DRAFT_25752 [Xylaria grammica]|nr:hypothetical protein F5X98DRAFT_25752 [Xylaria grammica]
MVVQLPDSALAAAVGVQIYSYICLVCSCLIILLVCKHRERDSYVALFSYCSLVGTLASIAQQLHTIVLWDDVKTEQFYYVLEHPGPELAIAGPSYGLDLVLFYIQYYCYNVEAMLALFWACSLAFSIFGPPGLNHHERLSRRSSIVAKVLSFFVPALFVGLLRLPAVRNSIAAFITVADFNLAASLTLGSIVLVAILAKYIHTRRRLHRWTVRYPLSRDLNSNSGESGLDSDSEHHSIYDGWLIVRFAIALAFIEAFQILTILSEVAQIRGNREEVLPEQPDISAARAVVDFVEFIPGVSTGLLVFLVFGTTKTCKRTLYISFIPRRFRLGTTSTDSHTSALAPRSNNQARTFLSSPSSRSSSGTSSAPAPSRVDEQVCPHIISPYPELGPPEPRFIRSQATDRIQNQEDNIDSCSFSSFDVCKISRPGDSRRAGSSVH